MCGIAGFIYLDGRPFVKHRDEPILRRMGDAIHHRGPDDTQTMLWENVGFVFKRLSIVDLEGGKQPFLTPDGRVSAMVNGEIYNHQEIRRGLEPRHALETHSDCEVVPYLYLDRDKELFDPVNGMFAAALLDRSKKRVLLARDRLGIKPLFYCVAGGGSVLVFASELKGLFMHPAVPRQFDWTSALARTWSGRDTRPEEMASCFHGIERVPAASMLDLDLGSGNFSVAPYWHLPRNRTDDSSKPASYYIERYRELLQQSVRYRLMADVEYGIFLSGGIDSAAIAALAAQEKQCPTFSVFSQSTLADAEGSYTTAQHLGLPNHQVFFDDQSVIVKPEDWRRIIWSCEFSIVHAEALFKYYLHQFAKARYPQLKVILLGQGSDEFAGGYMSLITGKEGPWTADSWKDVGVALHNTDITRAADEVRLTGKFDDLIRQGVLDRAYICNAAGRDTTREVWDLYTDAFRVNIDAHLWHEDRIASAHAIESRVPFLDHELLTFLASIPVHYHAELFSDKQILRRAVADLIPESIATRTKGYFYGGKTQHHAYKLMHTILTANSGELIDQAIAGSDKTDGPLVADGLKSLVMSVGNDPKYSDLPRLMQLVNMGVLADLAANQYQLPAVEGSLPVRELTADQFEPMFADARFSNAIERLDDSIVVLPPGHSLIQVKKGTNGSMAPGSWYVINYGQAVLEVKSPTLLDFLLNVDGEKTVAQIVADNGLNLSRVRKQVAEVVAQSILQQRE